MKTTLMANLIKRPFHSALTELGWLTERAKKRALRIYADWRVGASDDEKRAYKTTSSILLTFDDYGTHEQVERLLGSLRTQKVRAMFFLQGDWAEKNPELVDKIVKARHVIGNHTYSHPDLLSLQPTEVRAEIQNGVKSKWLRPPRGRYNAGIRNIARELGYRICYWSIDSDDWQGVSSEQISRKVLDELHPGAVILFHMHADNTLDVLPSLIAAIRAKGYKLASFDEQLWGPGK